MTYLTALNFNQSDLLWLVERTELSDVGELEKLESWSLLQGQKKIVIYYVKKFVKESQ